MSIKAILVGGTLAVLALFGLTAKASPSPGPSPRPSPRPAPAPPAPPVWVSAQDALRPIDQQTAQKLLSLWIAQGWEDGREAFQNGRRYLAQTFGRRHYVTVWRDANGGGGGGGGGGGQVGPGPAPDPNPGPEPDPHEDN